MSEGRRANTLLSLSLLSSWLFLEFSLSIDLFFPIGVINGFFLNLGEFFYFFNSGGTNLTKGLLSELDAKSWTGIIYFVFLFFFFFPYMPAILVTTN